MSRDLQLDAVTEYYETHPINEQQILDKLQLDGVDLANVTEDTLQNYDQDHYGGVAANDALALLAGIDNSCHVLDVCCELGRSSSLNRKAAIDTSLNGRNVQLSRFRI